MPKHGTESHIGACGHHQKNKSVPVSCRCGWIDTIFVNESVSPEMSRSIMLTIGILKHQVGLLIPGGAVSAPASFGIRVLSLDEPEITKYSVSLRNIFQLERSLMFQYVMMLLDCILSCDLYFLATRAKAPTHVSISTY